MKWRVIINGDQVIQLITRTPLTTEPFWLRFLRWLLSFFVLVLFLAGCSLITLQVNECPTPGAAALKADLDEEGLSLEDQAKLRELLKPECDELAGGELLACLEGKNWKER